MATTRIATPPRVPRSPKSANSPHEVRPELPANDPVVDQARALADTIRQLGRGRVPRDLPNLPLFSDAASSPPPRRPKLPSKLGGRKSRPRQTSTGNAPDLARHRRKCVVCNHPDRQEIEEQFIEWRGPGDIANDFQIEEARYIRRHARALGLYARRRENYLFTLDNLLERSDEIELTAAAYIKAVRAYACMCDTVRWTEPPIRVIGVRDSSAASQDRVDKEEQASSSSSLLPQAAFDHPASAKPAPSASALESEKNSMNGALAPSSRERLEGRGSSSTCPRAPSRTCVLEKKSVPAPSSSLPQAALEHPAAAEQTPPSGPSGAARSRKSVATSASSLPVAALDNPATAKPAPPSGRPDARDNPHFQGTASAVRLTGVEAGASAPKGSASAPLHHSQETIDAGASPRSSLVTSHSPLPSNRPSPRLETSVSDTKQKEEMIPNRPQNAK